MSQEIKLLPGLKMDENRMYEYCSCKEYKRKERFILVEFNTDKTNQLKQNRKTLKEYNKLIDQHNRIVDLLNKENYDELMKAMIEYSYIKMFVKDQSGTLFRCEFSSRLIPESTKFDRSEVNWTIESIPDKYPNEPDNLVCGFSMFREIKLNM